MISNNEIDELLKLAINTATEVGNFLVTNQNSPKSINKKTLYHWGIEEDNLANEIYVKKLASYSKSINIFSEESDNDIKSGLNWIIDPIEGTTNYRLGLPFFATQIALIKDSEILLSVIYEPIMDNTYYASRNTGSYLNDVLIFVSKEIIPKRSTFSMGKGTNKKSFSDLSSALPKLMENTRTIRHYGSCGLELAYVARGSLDYYINFGSQIYDYIPGVLLIREAGGQAITEKGNNWSIGDKNIIAGNKELISNIVDIIK